MKSYKERTAAVLEKVDGYNKTNQTNYAVDNGGATLSIKRGKIIALWTSFAAACLAIIIAFNLFLFLPFHTGGDISAYKDSEYYGLISVVNGLTLRKPQYKNNFEKLISHLKFSGGNKDDVEAFPPTSDDSSSNGDYIENTNNQVAGIIEGDILKCSTEYAFYLTYIDATHFELNVYSLKGVNSALASSHSINAENGTIFYNGVWEMYLSADCNTVTVITQSYNKNLKQLYTCIISLDVSNVNNVKESSRTYISGQYISSRLSQDTILLFTNFSVNTNPDFSDEAQFLPQTGSLNSMNSLPMSDIIYSDDATMANYTIVCAIDQPTLEINDNYAFLSYSQNVYVSEQNIYLTRSRSGSYTPDNEVYVSSYTDITCISYADGELELVNNAEIRGTVLNQYSMDEYDGVLRVVTEYYTTSVNYNGEYYSGASLYCIDLESFEICASLEQFSPRGENVFSVRFDGTTAYVCTAFVYIDYLSDPVFAIDLSDLNNITYKDTGTITGYSLSLMKFKDETLLGIGYGEWLDQLKVELYRETQDGVESVTSFAKVCTFSSEFKAYYIDANNGLVGLSINNDEYILLLFDGYGLSLVETISFDSVIDNDNTRTLYLDGYIYVFTDSGISVINWNA